MSYNDCEIITKGMFIVKKRLMCLLLFIVIVLNSFVPVVAYTQGQDGMGPVVITGGKRDFKWPVPGYYNIQSCFYDTRNHCAIDISAPVNTSAVASYAGTVIKAVDGGTSYYGDGFGNYVVLQHTYQSSSGTITLYSRYSHLNSVSVSEGTIVSAGTEVGKIGTTGSSTGYHLDFQILYGNWQPYQTYSIDPYANQLLELPSNIVVYDSWSCGTSYLALVKDLYSHSHSHSYFSHYEADHPHRVYNKCSCGDWYYTGETKHLSSCSLCNGSVASTIIYPTNGGVYKIASGVGNNMYLDFACTNTNVQIYENCDNHSDPTFIISQYFKLTHVGDGWYSIINIGNGKCVDIENTNPASGTNIMQWDYYQNDGQLYRFYDAGDGYCYIKSKLGTYADVANGYSVNNTNVWAYSFNGSNAQKWKLESHFHSYLSQVTTAATCTTTGVKTFTCNKCKHTYTETIAKALHSYTPSVTTQPTCTVNGVKTYTCSCGASYTETISATGHTNDWGDNKCDACGAVLIPEPTTVFYPDDNLIVRIAPSFVSGMFLNYDLETNNVQIYEDLDKSSNDVLMKSQLFKLIHVGDGWYIISNIGNGKVLDVEDGSSETKTNVRLYERNNTDSQLFRFYDAGDEYFYIKSKLGCYMDVAHGLTTNNSNVWVHAFNGNAAEKWGVTYHVHEYSEKIAEPTCTAVGYTTYTCVTCGDVYTEDIAMLEHTPDEAVMEDEIEATCTVDGSYNMVVYCVTCGKELNFTPYTITATGHTLGSDATCTEDQTCTVCGEVLTEKLGHDYKAAATVPTCTEDGYTTYTCANCTDSYVADKVAATGHSHTGVVTTEPTCTQTGVKTFACAACGDVYTELISALGHSEEIIPAVSATCTKTGLSQGVKCAVCGEILASQTATPVLVHADENADGYCDYCNTLLIQIGDVNGDGQITVSDARTALRSAVGLDTLTPEQKTVADANGDNNITTADARLILRAAVGLEDPKTWLQ